jgi:hypothetical protein
VILTILKNDGVKVNGKDWGYIMLYIALKNRPKIYGTLVRTSNKSSVPVAWSIFMGSSSHLQTPIPSIPRNPSEMHPEDVQYSPSSLIFMGVNNIIVSMLFWIINIIVSH